MRFYLGKRVWLGLAATLSIITALGIAAYVHSVQINDHIDYVNRANELIVHADQTLALTIDMESGQRGYTVTGNEVFLDPYIHASEKLNGHLKKLEELTKLNPVLHERITVLVSLVEQKIKFTHQVVEARSRSFEEAQALNQTLQGKILMDEIRALLHQISSSEKQELTKRQQEREQAIQRFNYTLIAWLLMTLIILVLVILSINTNIRARTEAQQSLKHAADQIKDLYDNAPCGYHSLNAEGKFENINITWIKWLQYTNREALIGRTFTDIVAPPYITAWNENFEKLKTKGKFHDVEVEVMRADGSSFPVVMNAIAVFDEANNMVKSRFTAFDYSDRRRAQTRIEQLNKELEAFSYSVSHDLRAPLRSIDGYTKILMEDYGPVINEEGNRLLRVVVKNTKRMGQLIDDLLEFSRIGRKEMNRDFINVDMVVRTITTELLDLEKQRNIDVQVEALEPCYGDLNLIRQVWINLISNAIKYTRNRERPWIHVRSVVTPTEIIYSVQDNGAGFDMKYAGKLFGVFQRLHKPQEFEGTGVGLAIVHRIVTRHGGKIWADANVNEGARFYFSLPKSEQEVTG
jgi:PAS domain S-box-containing protein